MSALNNVVSIMASHGLAGIVLKATFQQRGDGTITDAAK